MSKANNTTNMYNQISDVFAKDQVKTAVESLKTFKERINLIDSVIERRQEIEISDNLSKIHKYAHIFRKMLRKYKR